MERTFDVIVQRDSEGWYVASVPALRGCRTQAPTLDLLRERIREAILFCLEDEADDDSERLEFVEIQKVSA